MAPGDNELDTPAVKLENGPERRGDSAGSSFVAVLCH